MNQQADFFADTIASARTRLHIDAQHGAICPCCDKFVKVYHRKFNSGMARTLLFLYPVQRDLPQGWIDVQHFLMEKYGYYPGDYSKLVWWGMLEKHPTAEPLNGAKSAGLYRMTPKGRRFAECRITVQSHANEYMSKVLSFDGEQINITQALGKKFDYDELMRELGFWFPRTEVTP